MHSHAAGRTREERVRQVLEGGYPLRDYASYVPVENAVSKLRSWAKQGANIIYLSSHRNPHDVEKDEAVLRRYGFPPGDVLFRREGEEYQGVVENGLPDVLVEDDCESIGGQIEMVYPHIDPKLRTRIKSIVVPEFGGIDYLPSDLYKLISNGDVTA